MVIKVKFNKYHLCACIPMLCSYENSYAKEDIPTNEDTMIVKASRDGGDAKKIKREDITSIRGTNNADVFGNETSLQINNSRNEAGAIDVGIRGLQGNGRVPIVIDGSLQSTNTWRGYQGSSDRTYIDIDLINSIDIEKGVSKGKFSGGAIGGTIRMKTLSAEDIVPAGENLGFLFKASTFNNNRIPNVSSDDGEQLSYTLSNGVKNSHFNNGSTTFGLAYIDMDFDFVFAHSDRAQGNYFAGKGGADKYKKESPISPGQEVVNTSYESHSSILKTGFNLNPYNRVEFNFRRHEQKAGEVLAAYWYKYKKEDANGHQTERMPQWGLGSALVNTAAANYTYKPDNLFVDMDLGVWWTKGRFEQRNGISDNVHAVNAGQYLHRFSDERAGFNLANTSSLPTTAIDVTYGLEFMTQRIVPRSKRYQPVWQPGGIIQGEELLPAARNSKGVSKSLFVNAEYNGDVISILTGWRGHDFEANDLNEHKKINYSAKNDFFGTLTYHLSRNIDVYTKYSDAYRNPSLFESSSSGQTFSYSPKFPLKSEHAKSLELGVEIKKKNLLVTEDSASLRMAYFNNNIKDYLSQGVNPNKETDTESYIIMKNYDSFKLSGYEIEASYDSKYVFGRIDTTLYNATELCSRHEMTLNELSSPCNSVGFNWSLSPSRIPPKKNLSTSVGIKLFDQRLQLGTRVRYNSGKEYPTSWLQGTAATPVERQYASTTIDLFGKYNVEKNINVYFNIDNLTNRYAFDPGTVIYMPIPGRTFRLGVEAKF
ncbi:TonB-dependent receptor plug domain-containing protein [Pectobacterium parmentieri]|nr:ligand-gated channel [Pectobacterium parmentieri]AYH28604.1 ligand-gated channel [Pectobacterium parmentieri]MBI0470891.1 TonB-dependent receptor plug domain-containing protein [Pectobacterium parmentieri]MBI0493596.1 TonB-dependent receptor plug domain-containing protein [Pectobacterium parmentieri]MBI0518843.1 TonB-dependent receptor plug domain-containing protein [Pectobacterium parmentieri]